MSLGSWFRDYVYIPMGGNRVKPLKFFLNIFTVWFLTGFWHGAEWNFIIWGLYFAVLLLVEKFFLKNILNKSKVFSHIYVLFFIAISFATFSASSFTGAIQTVASMFGWGGLPLISESFIYTLKNYAFLIVISAVFATPLLKNLSQKGFINKICNVLEIPALIILLFIVTAYLADGSFNPFLYFRF